MTNTHRSSLYKWIELIKNGKMGQVLVDVKKKEVESKTALSCISAISLTIYNSTNKGKCLPANVSVEDVSNLTETLNTYIRLEVNKDTLSYFTSLFHIINYMFRKNHVKYTIDLFNLIMQMKEKLIESCPNLINPYTCILKNSITKICSNKMSETDQSHLKALFFHLIELMKSNEVLENGSSYLEIVHQASKVSGKDISGAVQVTDTGLAPFYKVKEIKNNASSVQVLFNIYSELYSNLLKIGIKDSALKSLKVHLDKARLMFKGNMCLDQCFSLLSNEIKILTWESGTLTEILAEMKSIVIAFKESNHGTYEQTTCGLMLSLLMHSQYFQKQIPPALSQHQLKLLSDILMDSYEIIKESLKYQCLLIRNICEFILFITQLGDHDRKIFKESVDMLYALEELLTNLVNNVRSAGSPTCGDDHLYLTKLFFVRYANLVRSFYLAGMVEECTPMAKRLYKLMLSLPKEELSLNQSAFEISFKYLVNLLGSDKLDEALKYIVIYMGSEGANIKSAFQLWGDLKHNACCDELTNHVNLTVLKVIKEITSFPESECPAPCFTDSQMANLLVLELETYFVNKSLRGTPVISAYKDLDALKPNSLSLLKGLVIALDVTSATTKYPNECESFYIQSLSLLKSLRKEKAKLNPIEVSVTTGNLLYTQLRCKLRDLRKDCECEMIRLAKEGPGSLVAELPENRPDPNDTCDINTNFSNLSLAKQRTLIKYVDSAVEHWECAYDKIQQVNEERITLTVTLGFLIDMGYLLRLYGDEIREAKTWRLLYNFASLQNDVNTIVIAINERVNMSHEVEEKLINTGKKLIDENPRTNNNIKQDFFISTASNYLKCNKISEGLKLLLEIESQERSSMQTIHLLEAMGRYQIINEYVFSLSPSYHFSFHKAISYLLYFSINENWGSFAEACRTHLLLINISHQMGEVYCAFEQPREARCYLKSMIELAQKLALPLKTAELLVVLARVDLASEMLDDFVVKLEGLEELLELTLPPLSYSQSSSPSSCTRASLRAPDYLTHPSSCQCLPCTIPLYRRLVLETITLRGAFCCAYGGLDEGLKYFELAICIQANLGSLSSREVQQSCAQMWLCYADAKTLSNQYEDALSIITRALNSIAPVKIPFYLQQILHQKFTFESLQQPRPSEICPRISLVDIKTHRSSKSHAFKTPKNKQLVLKSPLTVINNNVGPITPFARPSRRLRLPSSNDENSPVYVKQNKTKIKSVVNYTPTPCTMSANKVSFNVVDDDGNIVGVVGSKSLKTDVKSSFKSSELTKKKLFPFDVASSSLATKTKNTQSESKNYERARNTISQTISSVPNQKPQAKGSVNNKNSTFSGQEIPLLSQIGQDNNMKIMEINSHSKSKLCIGMKIDKQSSHIKTYGKSKLPRRRDDKIESAPLTKSIKEHNKTVHKNNDEFGMVTKLKNETESIADPDDIVQGTPPDDHSSLLFKSKASKLNSKLRHCTGNSNTQRCTSTESSKNVFTTSGTQKFSIGDFIEGSPELPTKRITRSRKN